MLGPLGWCVCVCEHLCEAMADRTNGILYILWEILLEVELSEPYVWKT